MPMGCGFLHGSPIMPSVDFRARNSLKELHSFSQQGDLEQLSNNGFEELSDPVHMAFQKEGHDQAPKPMKRKQKNCLHYREKRLARRLEAQLAEGTALKAISLKKRSASTSQKLSAPCTYEEEFVPSKPAWMARRDFERDEGVFLAGAGRSPWDDCYSLGWEVGSLVSLRLPLNLALGNAGLLLMLIKLLWVCWVPFLWMRAGMRFAKRQKKLLRRQMASSPSKTRIRCIDVVLFLHIILAYLMAEGRV